MLITDDDHYLKKIRELLVGYSHPQPPGSDGPVIITIIFVLNSWFSLFILHNIHITLLLGDIHLARMITNKYENNYMSSELMEELLLWLI